MLMGKVPLLMGTSLVGLMGLLGYVGKQLLRKILLCGWVVKGKIPSPHSLYFLAQIDDFGLK
jgi:hypothetical protein